MHANYSLLHALVTSVLLLTQSWLVFGQQFDLGDLLGGLGGGGGRPKVPAVTCPAGQKMVQAWDKPIESNGCSKPAGLEIPGEEDFTYCCDRHDACYSTCGISKAYCETDFGNCMRSLCKTNFLNNGECVQAADLYKGGVTIFGQQGFDANQKEHCMCVPADDFTEHYTKLIGDFYARHVDEDVDADFVTSLVSSPKWAGEKLRKLYYSLLKKYDSAIQHTGARRSNGRDIPRPPESGSSGGNKKANKMSEQSSESQPKKVDEGDTSDKEPQRVPENMRRKHHIQPQPPPQRPPEAEL